MDSSEPIQEMRSAVRFPVRLTASIKAGESGELTAETTDISAGGVLFEMDADLAVGSLIQFTIAMPANVLGTEADVLVNCMGRVVRCSVEKDRKSVAAVIDEYRLERR